MSSKKHTPPRQAAPVSRAHKQYDALAESMHAAGTLVRAWRQAASDARELARRELGPLQEAYNQRLKSLVLMLDGQYAEVGLEEVERIRLSEFLVEAAVDLLEEDEDPAIEEIFERHSAIVDENDEDDDAAFQAGLKKVLSEVYDAEIDEDIDLRSPEGQDLVRFLIEEDEEAEQARQRRTAVALDKIDAAGLRHEAQLEEMVDALIRELAPVPTARDMDETAFQAVTELIARTEAAIAERDLAQLLALRLELERRGLAGHVPEKQLAACNKLLKEELRILGLEIDWHKRELADDIPDISPELFTPDLMLRELNDHLAKMRESIDTMGRELTELRDVHNLKTWLRLVDELEIP